ncbi:MAG: hypothetical protein RBR08_16115 [Desulforegulaceae bacterium]|nr:hypothetical protein [Desulforegulaceae bacterium]
MSLAIKFSSLHHIDHSKNISQKIDITDQGKALEQYINRLIEEISTSKNRRMFEFQRDTTEVRVAIQGFLEGKYEKNAETNAKKLLHTEQKTQEKIAHLKNEIQKGSLFQAAIDDDGISKVIISKADHSEYLDEKDFLLHRGLPWKKRIFKAVLITFDSSKKVKDIFVFDTSSPMAKYWWEEYLELKEKHTDSHNTRTALDVLDKKVFSKFKKKYPADHTIIRNSAVGYFRNKEEFEIQDFIDNILENYVPVDPDLKKEELIAKTKKLPENHNFDTRFKIKKDEIKKRIVNKIALTDSIDLILKDHVEHLLETISSETDDEGNKFIKIRTDTGYDRFKKNDN